ncbi:hypothetical protein K439DRAFT_1622878 [Ramaria rubella]|nr:hypothetical protein K439DRAFT_1622878 [Ramaria rubella]
MTAYGTPNHKRHPKLAITFWNATEGWEAFIRSNQGEISFKVMYESLTSSHEGQKVFPQIGNLTGYLMAIDLSYAGLVQQPTAFELGRGSYSEMVIQGLVDGENDRTDCGSIYNTLHEKVEASLMEEELMNMKFDIFMLEHALCKKKRLRDAL